MAKECEHWGLTGLGKEYQQQLWLLKIPTNDSEGAAINKHRLALPLWMPVDSQANQQHCWILPAAAQQQHVCSKPAPILSTAAAGAGQPALPSSQQDERRRQEELQQ